MTLTYCVWASDACAIDYSACSKIAQEDRVDCDLTPQCTFCATTPPHGSPTHGCAGYDGTAPPPAGTTCDRKAPVYDPDDCPKQSDYASCQALDYCRPRRRGDVAAAATPRRSDVASRRRRRRGDAAPQRRRRRDADAKKPRRTSRAPQAGTRPRTRASSTTARASRRRCNWTATSFRSASGARRSRRTSRRRRAASATTRPSRRGRAATPRRARPRLRPRAPRGSEGCDSRHHLKVTGALVSQE